MLGIVLLFCPVLKSVSITTRVRLHCRNGDNESQRESLFRGGGWVQNPCRRQSSPVTAGPLCIQRVPRRMPIQGASGFYEAGEQPTHTKPRSLLCCTLTEEGG